MRIIPSKIEYDALAQKLDFLGTHKIAAQFGSTPIGAGNLYHALVPLGFSVDHTKTYTVTVTSVIAQIGYLTPNINASNVTGRILSDWNAIDFYVGSAAKGNCYLLEVTISAS